MKKLFAFFVFILVVGRGVSAEELEKQAYKMLDSHSTIKNLKSVLKKAEEALGTPVLFPTVISSENKNQYYAGLFSQPSKERIIISIDGTEDCHGAKVCSYGEMRLTKGGVPKMQQDRLSKQTITETVSLENNIKGFYTPGHAKADYWPASLQWIDEGTLYELVWSMGDRDDLIKMVNSAILGASHKKETH